MEPMFYLEDQMKVSMMPDGFHLTPSGKFFDDWFNVMELYKFGDVCSPESFRLCEISPEVMENILTFIPVSVSSMEADSEFLMFVVSMSELSRIKKEMGSEEIQSVPVRLRFVRMRDPEKCVECARQFNEFIKDSEKVNKVAERMVPYARFADRFDI